MFKLSLVTLVAGVIFTVNFADAQSGEPPPVEPSPSVSQLGEPSNPYLDDSCQALVDAAKDVTARAQREIENKVEIRDNGVSVRGGETIVHWPEAFLADVSGPKSIKLSQLKERLISIEKASIEAQCEIQFDGTRPPGA